MRNILFIVTCAVLSAACPGDPALPDATPCAMELQLGPKRANEFQVFSDGDRADLTLGFQGFRYISSTVRMATNDETSVGQVLFQISVEGQETYTTIQLFNVPEPETDGWRYADLLVFFNDIPIAELIGKQVEIIARGTVGNCQGTYTAAVLVVDDDNCIEQPDGTLLCE